MHVNKIKKNNELMSYTYVNELVQYVYKKDYEYLFYVRVGLCMHETQMMYE